MKSLEKMCREYEPCGTLIMGYDWAGSSSQSENDKHINWSDPNSVATSDWFVGYKAKIKGQIIVLAQDPEAMEIRLIAIEGGPVSELEANTLSKLKQEAQSDMKQKSLDGVPIIIEDMEYLSFVNRYGSNAGEGGVALHPTTGSTPRRTTGVLLPSVMAAPVLLDGWPDTLRALIAVPSVQAHLQTLRQQTVTSVCRCSLTV